METDLFLYLIGIGVFVLEVLRMPCYQINE